MELQLKNIGMIKEANVKIDGLTVIAGENDTGKSTVGKALFAIIKANNIAYKQQANAQKSKEILATRLNLVFDGNISMGGGLILRGEQNQNIVDIVIKDKNYISEFKRHKAIDFWDATLIQSPIVFDMVDFFNSVSRMRERQKFDYSLDFDVNYPYVLWDLFDKISKQNPYPKLTRQQDTKNIIQELIGGEFKQESGKFFYYKYLTGKALKIEMSNTAFGIKSFGVLQLLNDNHFLNQKICLILDEPEVHLHPNWQLKMAEVIVELVKNGVKIVVNSHSPYMIEALELYSKEPKISANFYLAKKQNEQSSIIDVTDNLEPIYATLAAPIETLEKDSLENFKW